MFYRSYIAAGLLVFGAGSGQLNAKDMVRGHKPDSVTSAPKESDRLAEVDATFLQKVKMINFAEIEAGEIATKRSKNAGVAAYGRMLIEDHKKSNEKIKELEGGGFDNVKDSDLADLKSNLEKTKDHIKAPDASSFNRTFANEMSKAHAEAIHMVEMSQPKLQSVTVKQFAKDLLPELKKHKATADGLLSQGLAH